MYLAYRRGRRNIQNEDVTCLIGYTHPNQIVQAQITVAQRPDRSTIAQVRAAYAAHGYTRPDNVNANDERRILVDHLVASLQHVMREEITRRHEENEEG